MTKLKILYPVISCISFIIFLNSCSSTNKDKLVSDDLILDERQQAAFVVSALQKHDAQAALKLGLYYDVIKQDPVGAAAWYKIAAFSGNDVGTHNLNASVKDFETKLRYEVRKVSKKQ